MQTVLQQRCGAGLVIGFVCFESNNGTFRYHFQCWGAVCLSVFLALVREHHRRKNSWNIEAWHCFECGIRCFGGTGWSGAVFDRFDTVFTFLAMAPLSFRISAETVCMFHPFMLF